MNILKAKNHVLVVNHKDKTKMVLRNFQFEVMRRMLPEYYTYKYIC